MRTFTKLHSLVAIAAGAAALAAGTIGLTASGATIQQRLVDPTGLIITGDNPVPVQQIVGDCGATCALTAEAGTVSGFNVWGFTTTPGTVSLPGPTIVGFTPRAVLRSLHIPTRAGWAGPALSGRGF